LRRATALANSLVCGIFNATSWGKGTWFGGKIQAYRGILFPELWLRLKTKSTHLKMELT
jgi:hypothetical protein